MYRIFEIVKTNAIPILKKSASMFVITAVVIVATKYIFEKFAESIDEWDDEDDECDL